MWLIVESTSNPNEFLRVLEGVDGAWREAQPEAPVLSVRWDDRPHYSRMYWVCEQKPASVRSDDTGLSATDLRPLRQFVEPRDREGLTEAIWLRHIAAQTLTIGLIPTCPAYCAWPELEDTYAGPFEFLPGRNGTAVGPREHGVGRMVKIAPTQLQTIEISGSPLLVCRPGIEPEGRKDFYFGTSDGLFDELDTLLLRAGSTTVRFSDLDEVLERLRELRSEADEFDPELDPYLRAALRRLPEIAESLKLQSHLVSGLLETPEISDRIHRETEVRVQEAVEAEKERILEEASQAEEALDEEIDALQERRDELAGQVAELEAQADSMIDQRVESAREAIRSLEDNLVAEVTKDVVLRRLVGAAPPARTNPMEGRRQEDLPEGPREKKELIYRIFSELGRDASVPILVAVAAAAYRRTLVLTGSNTDGWAGLIRRVLAGARGWVGQANADLLGMSDLLNTKGAYPDGFSSSLGDALDGTGGLSVIHLRGVQNAPWEIATRGLVSAVSMEHELVWEDRAEVVRLRTPSRSLVLVPTSTGPATFSPPSEAKDDLLVWNCDQRPPPTDLSLPIGAELLGELRSMADGASSVREGAWLEILDPCMEIHTGRIGWVWAAGGWCGEPPPGTPKDLIEEADAKFGRLN